MRTATGSWSPDPPPLFTRVVDDIVEQIRDGRLQSGDRVPSTRELADHYRVSAMTALRAMRELQVRGATYGMVGRGTFVRPTPFPASPHRPSATIATAAPTSRHTPSTWCGSSDAATSWPTGSTPTRRSK